MPEPGWTVTPEEAGTRLDKFLAHSDRLGSRSRAAAAIDRGKVYLNASLETDGSTRPGPRGDLDIAYEDDVLVVVNKPPGVLTVPLERKRDAPSVFDQIVMYLKPAGRRRPFVVHRIDQDSSGLVVFAKDPVSQGRLKAQFKRREPERVYLAVVYGNPDPPSGMWRDRLVWDTTALIQKETHPRDPRGTDAICE